MAAIPEQLASALATRYTLERELGAGGMAAVYLAHDLRHDRRVAVKVLRPELAAVIGAERFLSEIRTTANLQHPHILPLFDSGAADGFLFYVMPYIEGETVRDRLTREKQLPIPDALRIAGEVAAALDYAHRRGVIHRDIKPENILLHDGSALVADFGIALAASKAGGTRMTETGMSLGTPHYMSPEQALGEREITARSDVYALGAVTYEMLLGEPPFTGPTAQSIVAKVISEKPAPLLSRRARIPADVEDAVLTALEKLPADRFGSAAEFAAALSGAPSRVTAARLNRTRPVTVPKRRMALGIGLAVLVGVAAFLLGRGTAPDSVASDARPLSTFVVGTLRTSGVGYIHMIHRFAVSRQGDKVAFLSEDSTGANRIYLRSLGRLEPVALVAGAGPFFSPDGRSLGFFDEGMLSTVPVDGGVPVRLVELRAEIHAQGRQLLYSASWGDDNKIRFIGEHRGPVLYVIPAGGGALDSISFGRDSVVHRGELLPRGRLLLSLRLGDVWRVVIREPSGATRHLVDGTMARYAPSGAVIYSRKEGDEFALLVAPFDSVSGRFTGEARILQRGPSHQTPAEGTLAGDLVSLSPVTTSGRTVAILDPTRGDRELPIAPGNWVQLMPAQDGRSLILNDWNGQVRSLWRVDVASGTLARLTRGQEWFDPRPEPDNRGLFAISPSRPRWLYRLRWDGSGEPTLIETPWGMYPSRVSADGATLYTELDGDIYRVPLKPSVGKPEVVVSTAADEEEAWPSPDEKWLAWMTDRSGQNEVVVAPVNALESAVQVSSGGGVGLQGWSRDSRLFYFNGRSEVRAVEMGLGGPRLASSRVIFRIPPRTYAGRLLADGGGFAVIRGGPMLTDLVFSQGVLK